LALVDGDAARTRIDAGLRIFSGQTDAHLSGCGGDFEERKRD
jgi:hypothetical protein